MGNLRWQMGLFDVLAGESGDTTVCTTAGYYNDLFGIDRRWADVDDGLLQPCWAITHLLTGYVICAHLGNEIEVKTYIDEIMSFGNWDFAEPSGARALSKQMGDSFHSNSAAILDPAKLLPALWIRNKRGIAI